MPKPKPELLAVDGLVDRIARFVRNRVADGDDANDVLQDVLLKLSRSAGPSEADKLIPWAFAVARNAVTDFHRGRQRAKKRIVDGDVEDEPEPLDGRVDLLTPLEQLIALLSESDQHALRAVDLDGVSQRDYAASLGIDYPTAKSRVQRARKRLRREFDRCCRFELDGRGAPIACHPKRDTACC